MKIEPGDSWLSLALRVKAGGNSTLGAGQKWKQSAYFMGPKMWKTKELFQQIRPMSSFYSLFQVFSKMPNILCFSNGKICCLSFFLCCGWNVFGFWGWFNKKMLEAVTFWLWELSWLIKKIVSTLIDNENDIVAALVWS